MLVRQRRWLFIYKMANPQREKGYTAIANEIMEALAKTRISGEARQMLDVIIRKTYGFQRKVENIPTQKFMEVTGLPVFAIHKARKKLLSMNLITITKKGNSQVLTYSFQKDYHKWILLPKKVTVTQKGNRCNQKRSQTITKKGNPIYIKKERNYIKEKDFLFFNNKTFQKTFDDYLIMRTKIRKPATDRAKELVLVELHKHSVEIAIKMLENSIKNSWQGIFPIKQEQTTRPPEPLKRHTKEEVEQYDPLGKKKVDNLVKGIADKKKI